MGTVKRVDTFLLPLLLSIFVNFITKRACYTSPDGISITFHRCDLYDGIDSFVLSTFHRIKLKYVTTTKKSVCLLLLLLCGDIESQPGQTNNSEFKKLISKKGNKFCHQNIRGLYGKTDEVREILFSYNFDIFSLSETSISEDLHNAFFDIRGYSFIRSDRKSGQGGDGGLYIRDGIDFARRPDLENDETESLWVEIRLKNTRPLIFGTNYKPPDSSKHLSKKFNFFLSKTLQSFNSEKRESVITVDMNVNYLIENDHEVIKDIFTDNGFKQILNTQLALRRVSTSVEESRELVARMSTLFHPSRASSFQSNGWRKILVNKYDA